MGCAFYTESDREENCIDCSKQISKRDLDLLDKYKANITTAAHERCFPSALLAAFISKQTKAGAELENGFEYEGTEGWLHCHYAHKKCFGLMRLPESEYTHYFYIALRILSFRSERDPYSNHQRWNWWYQLSQARNRRNHSIN